MQRDRASSMGREIDYNLNERQEKDVGEEQMTNSSRKGIDYRGFHHFLFVSVQKCPKNFFVRRMLVPPDSRCASHRLPLR